MDNKERLQRAIKALETRKFKWTPKYNGCWEPTEGCLVDLFCNRFLTGGSGVPLEVFQAIADLNDDALAFTPLTRWNDKQKSVRPILKVLRMALKKARDKG